jgi:hypothetical protein
VVVVSGQVVATKGLADRCHETKRIRHKRQDRSQATRVVENCFSCCGGPTKRKRRRIATLIIIIIIIRASNKKQGRQRRRRTHRIGFSDDCRLDGKRENYVTTTRICQLSKRHNRVFMPPHGRAVVVARDGGAIQ